jgi:hypothetical protein
MTLLVRPWAKLARHCLRGDPGGLRALVVSHAVVDPGADKGEGEAHAWTGTALSHSVSWSIHIIERPPLTVQSGGAALACTDRS